MPYKAKHPCKAPSCPALVEAGHSYCARHETKYRRESDKAYDRGRQSPSKRGYNAWWGRRREQILQQYPACSRCGGIAEEVHHVIPLRDGGTNSVENLEPLCASCHSRVTRLASKR